MCYYSSCIYENAQTSWKKEGNQVKLVYCVTTSRAKKTNKDPFVIRKSRLLKNDPTDSTHWMNQKDISRYLQGGCIV